MTNQTAVTDLDEEVSAVEIAVAVEVSAESMLLIKLSLKLLILVLIRSYVLFAKTSILKPILKTYIHHFLI